mgnify:CR=1 FL=1
MAISNDVTTNRLNKKINYGVARTEMDSVIGPTGEAMGSPVFNPSNDLWINSDQLPASFLGTSVNTSDMLVYQYTSSASGAGTADGETVGVLELKAASGTDVTYGSGNYATYIACTNRSSAAATRLQDWIPFGFFGATYLTSFAVATEGYHLTNTNLSATAAYYSQIYPSSSGYEFYFDTDAGLLVFAGSSGPPSNLTAGRSIYLIKGARYQGPKGVANMPVSKLSDIHTATPSDSDVLIWDNGNSRWAPGTSLTKVDIGEANVTVANIATLYTTTLQVGSGTTTVTTDDVKTTTINLTTLNTATAFITTAVETQCAKVFDLTDGRVTYASAMGELVDSSNLTFDGTVLTSTEVTTPEANVTVANIATAYITTEATIATAKVSDLTDGRVVLAGTSGELEDSGALTFDGTVLTSTEITTPEANVTVANVTTLYVPSTATIGDLTVDNGVVIGQNLTVSGNVTIQGGATTIESTTLTVDDKNIELGSTGSPTDITADGGGITLKGTSDKTILWTDSTDSWDVNQDLNIDKTTADSALKIDGTFIANTSVVSPSTKLTAHEANVTSVNTSSLYVTTDATVATAKISDLTSGRVVLAGTSGEIEDSGNLTFDGTVLTSPRLAFEEANVTVANVATLYVPTIATIFKTDIEEANITVANITTLYTTTLQVGTGTTTVTSDDVKTGVVNVTTSNISTAYITTEATIATAKVSDLTSGRVVLAGTGGELEDHTNLTFDGTVLTSTEVTTPEANVTVANIATAYITTEATIATAKISDLTSGRVVLAGTSGEIEDSTNLTFDGTVLTSTELTTPEANITVANVSTLYVTTSVGGEAILDDDSFATASATTLATSESIKAYVDAEILTEDTIAELNDTTISPGLAENDVLTYRGGAWINSNEVDLAEANITVVNVATLYSTSSAVMNDVDITKVDIGEANVTVSNTVTTWITDYLCVKAGGYGAYINSKLHTPEANITVANVSTAYVTNKATVQNLDVDVRLAGSPAPVGMGCVPEANIAVANIATLHITTDSTIATAKISDLTDGRVVLAGTSGELEDSTNLTFDGTVLTSTEVTTPEANITVANVATLYVTSQIDKLDIAEVDIAEANVTVGNVATLYVPGDGGPTNLALNVGDGAITINTDDFTTSLSANATLQGTTQITQLNSSTVTESGITVAQYGGALGTPTNKVWANSSGLHYQTKQLAGTDDATALAIALG